jgi:hypothetical protein
MSSDELRVPSVPSITTIPFLYATLLAEINLGRVMIIYTLITKTSTHVELNYSTIYYRQQNGHTIYGHLSTIYNTLYNMLHHLNFSM